MAKKDYLLPMRPGMATSEQETLAMRHLAYARNREQSRYLLAEHAMFNTELLMDYAVEIMQKNPEAAPMLKEIMSAYTGATSEEIRLFGMIGTKYR